MQMSTGKKIPENKPSRCFKASMQMQWQIPPVNSHKTNQITKPKPRCHLHQLNTSAQKKKKKGKEPVLDAQLREVVYMYTKTENSLNPQVFQVSSVH